MRDTPRRYRAIRDALIQDDPGPPTGTGARHLTTLAAMICGIVLEEVRVAVLRAQEAREFLGHRCGRNTAGHQAACKNKKEDRVT
jgi:hypothetical protein